MLTSDSLSATKTFWRRVAAVIILPMSSMSKSNFLHRIYHCMAIQQMNIQSGFGCLKAQNWMRPQETQPLHHNMEPTNDPSMDLQNCQQWSNLCPRANSNLLQEPLYNCVSIKAVECWCVEVLFLVLIQVTHLGDLSQITWKLRAYKPLWHKRSPGW